ncbi:MAG: bifunctional tetrahydrofolate synthase/dihydrofolate synthase [Gammaproteobacteria bacterium]|nr:bifunctional tetrahydrofolate synthase/dihydrofolate synthase [Gammaproteobacteria bacterium]
MTASFRSLDDWLPWLESLSPREIVLGLERVEIVLDRLRPARPELVINVTGTNGKGSCVAMFEAILRRHGMRTGCYTSPHLSRYNERMRIDGESATDADVVDALKTVEAARGDVPLTFFEFGTLAAILVFARAGVDAWILEIGMGGRLDAVNAIEPDGCLITNVGLDHCAWLGNDIESIAREKAGIMRAGKPAVFGSHSVPRAITDRAAEIGAGLRLPGRDFDHAVSGRRWTWHGERLELTDLPRPALSGARQLDNAAAVLALLEALGRDDALERAAVADALTALRLPGRFQVVDDRYILDVAHNPPAARVLAEQLADYDAPGRVICIIGMLADKDVAGFVGELTGQVDEWVAVDVSGTRAQSADDLARPVANATGRPCLVAGKLQAALEQASRDAGPADRILVTGSFYVVGPALDWLANN